MIRTRKNNQSHIIWTFWIISIFYQLGVTLYFLGFSCYRFLGKRFYPIPQKNLWTPPLFETKKTRGNKKKEKFLSPLIWIHAVSGGEVKLADRIIQEFYPRSLFDKDGKILLTYCSTTGSDMAKKLKSKYSHLTIAYLPIDFYPLTRRWVKVIDKHYKLTKYIVIEHDFWPNWLWAVKLIGAKRIGINYFLKKRDFDRYRLLPSTYCFVHNLDILLTQNQKVSQKVTSFQPNFQVIEAGNLKYGLLDWNQKKIENLQKIKLSRKYITITLGSSHAGEEALILNALKNFFLDYSPTLHLRLIIIPRHPERARTYKLINFIKKFTDTAKVTYELFPSKKILKEKKSVSHEIILVKEMGWSEYFYQQSDIVIIGDTFIASQGGHNIIEPLSYGKCVIYGPYMVNYADITPELEDNQIVIRISKEKILNNLRNILNVLISDPSRRKRMGKLGLAFLKNIQYDRQIYKKVLDIN